MTAACTADRHGSFRNARDHGCRCDTDGVAAFFRYRERENARRRDAKRREWAEEAHESVTAPDFYAPAIPEPTHAATGLQEFLYTREALPCRDRPEVFHGPTQDGPVGDDLREARRLCSECLFEDTCLTVALVQHDDWAFLGGTLPSQRRVMRALMPTPKRVAA